MTVSIGTGVSIGNIVTTETNSITGSIALQANGNVIALDAGSTNYLRNTSTNLFNYLKVSSNYTISSTTGALVSNGVQSTSEFIPVTPGNHYYVSLAGRVAWYTASGAFISSTVPGTPDVVAPVNAGFIRAVFANSILSTGFINAGAVSLGFQPYSVGFAPDFGFKVSSVNTLSTEKIFSINGSVDAAYVSSAMPSFGAIVASTHTSIYTLYDALVTAYPNYVTRAALGLDAVGNTIYKYTFSPAGVVTDQPRNFAKMILISGVHGLEKAGVHCLYLAMKAVCDEWSAYAGLETLRWNATFIVIPVVNPYGFDNNLRKNENGVDLARNFPVGWTLVSPSSDPYYGGATPLSEKSSQYVNAVLTANTDAIYFGSFHNFFTPTTPNDFIWHASSTQFGVDLANAFISRQSRGWKTRFAWLPQNDTSMFGYTTSVPAGSESLQAAALGIQGGTFEICVLVSDAPDPTGYSTHTATMGKETVINWLILMLDKASNLYNNRAF